MTWRRYHIRDVVSGEGEAPPGAAVSVGVRREQRRQGPTHIVPVTCSYSPHPPPRPCPPVHISPPLRREYGYFALFAAGVALLSYAIYVFLLLFYGTETRTHCSLSTPHAALRGGHRFLAEKIAAEGFIVVIPDREGDRACGWGPVVLIMRGVLGVIGPPDL